MKKTLLLVVVAVALLFPKTSSAEALPKRVWKFGPEIYHFSYREASVGVEDKGVMFGLAGSYTRHINRAMMRLEMRGAFGEVDYTSESTGSVDNISDYTLEPRILLGYDFIDEESHWYTVYTGFGYRYLNDGGGGSISTTGALGYDRESNYFYFPLGIEGTAIITEDWNISAFIEFDILIAGQQYTHLSTASSRLTDLTNDQNRGFGFKTALNFERATEKYDISFGPFFRYWKINVSETATAISGGTTVLELIEPNNQTSELGLNVSVLY